MKRFWAISKRSFQRQMSYRTAVVAGLSTNFFFGIIRIAILLALYNGEAELVGFSRADVITYAVLTQAVLAYLNFFGWYELADSVHSGEIAVDLLRPINLFSLWLARDAGRAFANFFLRGVTILFLFSLFYPIRYPRSLTHLGLIIVTVILSWLLNFSWQFFVNLAAFYSPNARGIGRFAFILVWFASGFLMPIRFFPDGVQSFLSWLPFPHLLNTPVEIYMGTVTTEAIGGLLGLQFIWFLLLVLFGQIGLRFGIKRLVILGG